MNRFLRVLYNLKEDMRIRSWLGGTIKSRYRNEGAYDVANSDYQVLRTLFKKDILRGSVVLDVGCGKGRFVNFALKNNVQNIVGIEIDELVAKRTSKIFSNKKNVEIINVDATTYVSKQSFDIIYMYNPFSKEIVEKFFNSAVSNKVITNMTTVYYFNPKHIDSVPETLFDYRVESVPNTNKNVGIIRLKREV